MKPEIIQKFLSRAGLQSVLLIAFTVIIAINYTHLAQEVIQVSKIRRYQAHQPVGKIFYGLDNVFKGIPYIGYFTDKDLEEAAHNKQFSEAQYTIAPTILDINNTEHEFILFDCLDESLALKKIQEIHATILQKRGGLILARRQK